MGDFLLETKEKTPSPSKKDSEKAGLDIEMLDSMLKVTMTDDKKHKEHMMDEVPEATERVESDGVASDTVAKIEPGVGSATTIGLGIASDRTREQRLVSDRIDFKNEAVTLNINFGEL